MRSYFDHNAISEGRKRVRDAHDIYVRVANQCFPALFMSRADAIASRCIGWALSRQFRRGVLPPGFHA